MSADDPTEIDDSQPTASEQPDRAGEPPVEHDASEPDEAPADLSEATTAEPTADDPAPHDATEPAADAEATELAADADLPEESGQDSVDAEAAEPADGDDLPEESGQDSVDVTTELLDSTDHDPTADAEATEPAPLDPADLSEGSGPTFPAGAIDPPVDATGDDLADDDDDALAALAEFDAPRRPAPAGVQLSEELPIDPEDDLRGVEGEASPRLVSILESLLFAAARPLKVNDLRKLLAETSKHQIQLALAHLMAVTRDRGISLAQVAGGFQFRTHPDNAVWVQKMLQSKPARLSRTQIETLAIVAYRQPITRPEIDDVRGVDSGAVLKGLLERELVQIVGKKEEPGRPLLYGTTVKFLEFFNLRGLRDLPTLRDFRDLSEESKATLRTQLGATEAEALGQGVLGFPPAAAQGAEDMPQSPEQDPTPMELPGQPAPDELVPPDPERLPGPSPDEIRPPDPGTDSPSTPDEIRPPSPDIADVPGTDPGPEITEIPGNDPDTGPSNTPIE